MTRNGAYGRANGATRHGTGARVRASWRGIRARLARLASSVRARLEPVRADVDRTPAAPAHHPRAAARSGRPEMPPAWQAPLLPRPDADGAQLALMPDPRDVVSLAGTAWAPRTLAPVPDAAAGDAPAGPAGLDSGATPDTTRTGADLGPRSLWTTRPTAGVRDTPDRGVTHRRRPPAMGTRGKGQCEYF